MNVGQILETHLGWAAMVLGFQSITPVFDGATEDEIHAAVDEANNTIKTRRKDKLKSKEVITPPRARLDHAVGAARFSCTMAAPAKRSSR